MVFWGTFKAQAITLQKTENKKAGCGGHTHNPSTWKAELEDLEFKASLSYKVRP
jgi:hypothetical protein